MAGLVNALLTWQQLPEDGWQAAFGLSIVHLWLGSCLLWLA